MLYSENGNNLRSNKKPQDIIINNHHNNEPYYDTQNNNKCEVPNPVEEVSIEHEQSEKCNESEQVIQEENKYNEARSSVQSLINMMTLDKEGNKKGD